jgi:shikimate kinase
MQSVSSISLISPFCLILLGIKHCGKSTQGKRLAAHYGCPFYDTDDVIKEMTGLSPRELYSLQGEDAFLKAETAACQKLVSTLSADTRKISYSTESGVSAKAGKLSAVIATGGGICNNKAALDVLHDIGFFVFLYAPEKVAADRIAREIVINKDGSLSGVPAYIEKKNPHSVDDVREIFHDFYVERTNLYMGIARVDVCMMPVSKEENTQRILEALSSSVP